MNRHPAIALLAVVVAACAGPAVSPSAISTPVPTAASVMPAASATLGASATPAQTPTSAGATPDVKPSNVAVGPVTLVTHDSFAASADVIAQFEAQSGAKLNVLKGGDAGTMVNQAILTQANPLGDVLYGVDNTFLSRALDAAIFVPYVSPAAAAVPAQFKVDPQNRVTPIDFGDVCVVYDTRAVTGAMIPKTINELTNPAYKGSYVVENPATSSPGLAFMLATIARFGESGDYTWLDYWRDLRANDVLVSSDWNDAYYNEFSGTNVGRSGGRPFVVSYATDPAGAAAADTTSGTPGVQFIDDGCFRQQEFAGVLAGAKNAAGAQAWIDFMVSPEFQSDMPLNMYVLPVNPEAQLPDVFTQYQSQASDPLTLDPAAIATNRDQWIQQWTDAVIH